MNAKRIKLSFEDEDEDGEESAGLLSSSLHKNQKRRIIQAPAQIPPQVTQPSKNILRASYRQEDLNHLKHSQSYSNTNSSKNFDDISSLPVHLELAGDDAEALEAALHPEPENLLNQELKTKKESKSSSNRIYIHGIREDTKNTADLTQENDLHWEETIIQRGTLQSQKVYSLKETEIGTKSVDGPDVLDILSILDIRIDQVEANINENERKLELMKNELTLSKSKIVEQSTQVEVTLNLLRSSESVRIFFSDVIEMLREKSVFIEELLTAWQSTLQQLYNNQEKSFKQYQDDCLRIIKRNNELIAIGEYNPLASLHTSSASPEDESDLEQTLLWKVQGKVFQSQADACAARNSIVQAIVTSFSLEKQIDFSKLVTIPIFRFDIETEENLSLFNISNQIEFFHCFHDRIFSINCDSPNNNHLEEKYLQVLSQIRNASFALFEDVAFELTSISDLLIQANHFRENFGSKYYESFFPLSLGDILKPYITIEILNRQVSWLFASSQILDEHLRPYQSKQSKSIPSINTFSTISSSAWYGTLTKYINDGQYSRAQNGLYDDKYILQHLASTVLLSIIQSSIQFSLSFLLRDRCRNFKNFLTDIQNIISFGNEDIDNQVADNFRIALSNALKERWNEQVENLCFAICRCTIDEKLSLEVLNDEQGCGTSFMHVQLLRTICMFQNLENFLSFLTKEDLDEMLHYKFLSAISPMQMKLAKNGSKKVRFHKFIFLFLF
jgi:hypothetical protein